MDGHRHALAALPPGKTRYPLYRRLGGPQGRSGRVRKISPHTGIRAQDRPARSESLYRLTVTEAMFKILSLGTQGPIFQALNYSVQLQMEFSNHNYITQLSATLQSTQNSY